MGSARFNVEPHPIETLSLGRPVHGSDQSLPTEIRLHPANRRGKPGDGLSPVFQVALVKIEIVG